MLQQLGHRTAAARGTRPQQQQLLQRQLYGSESSLGKWHASAAGNVRRNTPVTHSSIAVPVGVLDQDTQVALKPLPRALESITDDPTLHNPLQRLDRQNTSWFGVIADFEGVIVDETTEWQTRAWRQVAEEFGHRPPLGQQLNRILGVRNETVVTNVLNWTRNPVIAQQIAKRKEEVYDELSQGVQPASVPGSEKFFETLRTYQVPMAVATVQPEHRVKPVLTNLGLDQYFEVVVASEDVGAPEVEYYYMYAAQKLERPPMRCIVVGNNNKCVEAAHELGMKSVIVTGGKAAWNFSEADLVVRNLNQLSFLNLKKLFGNETLVEPKPQLEEETL